MKIAIVGASRGIGRALVDAALARGHTVTALVRSRARLPLAHTALTIVEGDARDAEAIDAAVRGQDAICLCLGTPPTRRPVDLFSTATTHTLAAMRVHGVRRLIAVTGIGAGETRGHGGFVYDRITNPLLLGTIYADKDRQEALIRASDTDWTIVRPGFLTNGPARRRWQALIDMTGVRCGSISRADVAEFILDDLATPRYARQAPLLTD